MAQPLELEIIHETIARSKSIVKESIDLTKKNAERKKQIEFQLKNYLPLENPYKNFESSFTLDLESPQSSIINKDKAETSSDSHFYYDSKIKSLNCQLETLEGDNVNLSRKLNELYMTVRTLEEENSSIRSRFRDLMLQIKDIEEEKAEKNKEIAEMAANIKCYQQENEKLTKQNAELIEIIIKMQNQEEIFYEKNRQSIDSGNKHRQLYSKSNERLKLNEDTQKIHSKIGEISSEPNFHSFNSLKTENFSGKVINISQIETLYDKRKSILNTKDENSKIKPRKTEICTKGKLIWNKNEDIVEKLEENYLKTDEKFKRISTHLSTSKSRTNQKKLSISFDNVNFVANEGNTKLLLKAKNIKKQAALKSKKGKKL